MKRLFGYTGKCQHLGAYSKRCSKNATIRSSFFGDESLYNSVYVEIDVCEKHATEMFGKKRLENLPFVVYKKANISAVKRVLSLLNYYLSEHKQGDLWAAKGGMMTVEELRTHIKGALKELK